MSLHSPAHRVPPQLGDYVRAELEAELRPCVVAKPGHVKETPNPEQDTGKEQRGE